MEGSVFGGWHGLRFARVAFLGGLLTVIGGGSTYGSYMV